MSVWKVMLYEIAYRKLGFVLALVGVSAAVASLVGALALLELHDAHTDRILARREAEVKAAMDSLCEDVRNAMHRLGYNAVILPKDQPLGDWYSEEYASESLPERAALQLNETQDLCERYLPRLRQRVKWREKKWTVIVVGVGKETILEAVAAEPRPLVQETRPGACALGYELHHALDVHPGDQITLLGRTFVVARCEEERGTKDDITIWMPLADAQTLLGKLGLINEILIVEHLSVWGDVQEVRRKVERVLPECQVVEIASETMARTHARRKMADEAAASVQRERDKRSLLKAHMARNVLIIASLSLLVCGLWVGFLMYLNVRDRAVEMGTLMALGYRPGQLQAIVLSKAALLGFLGALVGCAAGMGGVFVLKYPAGTVSLWSGLGLVAVALVVGSGICLAASWLPARAVGGLDPADVLRGE